jgi:hypothetical protein
MLASFISLRGFFRHKTVEIDNWSFRVTYRLAITVHVALFVVMTTHLIFGEAMECEMDGMTRMFANSFCFSARTFNVKRT